MPFNGTLPILRDASKPIAARALIPEIINNVDPGGFATIAKQMFEEQGAESEIAPYLARGVASIQADNNQQEVEEIKRVIRSLAPAGPAPFRQAADLLGSPDETSSDS